MLSNEVTTKRKLFSSKRCDYISIHIVVRSSAFFSHLDEAAAEMKFLLKRRNACWAPFYFTLVVTVLPSETTASLWITWLPITWHAYDVVCGTDGRRSEDCDGTFRAHGSDSVADLRSTKRTGISLPGDRSVRRTGFNSTPGWTSTLKFWTICSHKKQQQPRWAQIHSITVQELTVLNYFFHFHSH